MKVRTPICDFVENYAKSRAVRAHMPGHKGAVISENPIFAVYPYDITEISGADNLFEADGIIAESEEIASEIFGTYKTFYSAFGSTNCIQAMLAAVCNFGDTVIAARNCHKAFLNTAVLLGLKTQFISPKNYKYPDISFKLSVDEIEEAILQCPDAKCVFVTSPNYLGEVLDIKSIAEIIHKHNKILLVDNAHGAYLAFLQEKMHPIKLGADLCCDSAHKTLPVLTGGAYLHCKDNRFCDEIKAKMALFASSSPSYLILQSLDYCNRILSEDFSENLAETVTKIAEVKAEFSQKISVVTSEPLKITLDFSDKQINAIHVAKFLSKNGVEAEYYDEKYIVLMLSPYNSNEDFEKIKAVLLGLCCDNFAEVEAQTEAEIVETEKILEPCEAYFREKEKIPVEESIGKICAETVTLCPPCIPIVIIGEKIDKNIIKILKKCSFSFVTVLK